MKKMLLLLGLTIAATPSAFASDNGPGCGIGAVVWKGKTGSSAHTSAGTTNALILPWKYIGISSGLFGCDVNKTVYNDSRQDLFVAQNMDNLVQNASSGQGDYLDALATLKGINEQDRDAFFNLAQTHFDEIFSSPESSATEVLAKIDLAMTGHQDLAKYVR